MNGPVVTLKEQLSQKAWVRLGRQTIKERFQVTWLAASTVRLLFTAVSIEIERTQNRKRFILSTDDSTFRFAHKDLVPELQWRFKCCWRTALSVGFTTDKELVNG
jgi:hypothetical protein